LSAASKPKPKFPVLAKFPWLPYATGGLILLFVLFAVFEETAYQSAKTLRTASLAEIAQTKPKSGMYKVTGGMLYYVYAEAVGFTNDHDKDAGSSFNSYVPLIDPQTKRAVALVELDNYSPKDFNSLIDDGKPQDQIGEFVDPATVDPRLYPMFDERQYPIPKDTPVMVKFGGATPPDSKIITAAVLTLLVIGGGWGISYQIAKPKKRRKSFSERYPDRKVY